MRCRDPAALGGGAHGVMSLVGCSAGRIIGIPSRSCPALIVGRAARDSLLRIKAAGIQGRVLLLQSEREDLPSPPGRSVLPLVQGPLLLDTVGLTPTMQMRVLAELAAGSANVPTLLLAQPTDGLLHRLAPSCPVI